jgi:acetylornithine deacetylase/succinyl-diaminopimelate desuccinylase-like protein
VRDSVDKVFLDQRIQQAFLFISQNEPQIEADQIRLTEIPAPPFGEGERARHFSQSLIDLGLRPVTDSVGNVIAAYGNTGHNPVVACAHLDTVFPISTPLELRRKNRTLYLPGISDNGAGLVALLWAFRAAKENGIDFQRPVIAVANVGEEGQGDLRGVRHLFNDPPWQGRECEFIAIDGSGLQRVTHQALGSRRFRVRMTGPGGHSWADFGRPNPVHAMATMIHTFCSGAMKRTGCSFNFGVIRGGISVNAIPREASVEVDLRSTALTNLDEMERQLRQFAAEATRALNIECTIESIGSRPSWHDVSSDSDRAGSI